MEHPYHDGPVELVGHLARPEARGKAPGVLILHEAPGINEHSRMRAGMFAKRGCVALAADLYGGGRTFSGPEAGAQMAALREDPDRLRARIKAGLSALAALDGVDQSALIAVGYCFGGMCALELARSGAPIRAAVSFHGLLGTDRPAGKGEIAAAILVLTGSEDPLVPPADVASFEAEMTAAEADWQVMVLGGARHAFTNRGAALAGLPGLAYDERADRRSWDFMLAFLGDLLGRRA